MKNLRASREWVGDRWVDIEPNPNILGIIYMETKLSTSSAASKEPKSDNSPMSIHKVVSSHKLSAVEEEDHDLAGMTLTNVPLKDECINSEQRAIEAEEKEAKEKIGDDLGGAEVANGSLLNKKGDSDKGREDDMDDSNGENNLVECEIGEVKCEAEAMEMAANCSE